jgi:nucleotide-binding universal stress UspA family protein
MFKTILVPLDGSALSEEVLPLAQGLLESAAERAVLFAAGETAHASRRRAGLRRAVPLMPMAGATVRGVVQPSTPAYYETKDQAVERQVNELLDYLHQAGAPLAATGKDVQTVVHLGPPAQEIIDYARENDVDLIVMATHGRSGLRETLQGSVTAEVVRSGVAPVMVVRPKDKKRLARRRRRTGNGRSKAT